MGVGMGKKQQARALGTGRAVLRRGNSYCGVRIWVWSGQKVYQIGLLSYGLQKVWERSTIGRIPLSYVVAASATGKELLLPGAAVMIQHLLPSDRGYQR